MNLIVNTRCAVRLAAISVFVACSIPPAPAADGRGMTWLKIDHDNKLGIDALSCYGNGFHCDAYRGDTSCATELPILCLKRDNSQRPPYGPADYDFYRGWAGAHVATTLPVLGTSLTTAQAGHKICRTAFGPGWRMAEFHDNRIGGWGFRAYGNVRTDTRFWVKISDQPANCWDN